MILLLILLLIPMNSFAGQWTSANVVSGTAGTTGNVSANSGFFRHEQFVCSDTNWTETIQTCEHMLMFEQSGADSQLTVACTSPVGDIVYRNYIASTNTMDSAVNTIWTDATYGALAFRVIRNPNESFYRIYFPRMTRASTCATATEIDMIKSNGLDLTTATWSSPTTVIASTGNTEIGGWMSLDDGSYVIVVNTDANNSSHTALYRTTDNGESFSFYSTVSNTGATNGPCNFVKEDNSRRMLGIYRQNSTGILKYVSSSDYGLTWTNLANTNIGPTGSGVNVEPKMVTASGRRNRIAVSFYSRTANRFLASSPTLFSSAINGQFTPTYLLGGSSDGNGGMAVINASTNKYILTTDTTATPTNALNWWICKDIYQTDKIQGSKLNGIGTN